MTTAAPALAVTGDRLVGWSLFAGTLAMAGLPIYIHAPKYYADTYGVSLAALGAVLFALRLIDVVQDPVLGWLSQRLRARRAWAVAVALAVMAVSMLGLFAVTPPVAPVLWFAVTLTGLFSGFSFLTITFYAEGVAKAPRLGADGYLRLASWREGGALAGVCLAAVAPTVLAGASAPFAVFAGVFAGLCVAALVVMRGEWSSTAAPDATPGLRPILADGVARRLLLLALVNAMPVAATSTLFLFYVESRLAAPGWEGPLLLLFFLAAAGSAPLWGRAAARFGAKRALLAGMGLAVLAFVWAATLGAGDVAAFAVICIASGAALGADLTLLPAIFARRLEKVAPEAAQAFGLWSFASKLALAFAAALLLPLLEGAGFDGPDAPPRALALLTILYAVVPCVLKLGAIALLAATPLPEG